MNEFRTGWLEEWRARAGDRWWWPLAAVLVLGAGVGIWALTRSPSGAEEQAAAPPAESPSASAAPAPAEPAEPSPPSAPSKETAPPPPPRPSAAAAPDAGEAPSPTVKLTFRTFPPRPAVVMWGAKRLGVIDRNKPLVVERPRDSGPLDVIVRSQGYVPVHTRAYTFTDSNIDVKITPVDKKDTIYGYKEPIYDAGVPFPAEAAELP